MQAPDRRFVLPLAIIAAAAVVGLVLRTVPESGPPPPERGKRTPPLARETSPAAAGAGKTAEAPAPSSAAPRRRARIALQIRDEESGEGIAGAEIRLEGAPRFLDDRRKRAAAVTDASGRAAIELPARDIRRLRIEAPGYRPARVVAPAEAGDAPERIVLLSAGLGVHAGWSSPPEASRSRGRGSRWSRSTGAISSRPGARESRRSP